MARDQHKQQERFGTLLQIGNVVRAQARRAELPVAETILLAACVVKCDWLYDEAPPRRVESYDVASVNDDDAWMFALPTEREVAYVKRTDRS